PPLPAIERQAAAYGKSFQHLVAAQLGRAEDAVVVQACLAGTPGAALFVDEVQPVVLYLVEHRRNHDLRVAQAQPVGLTADEIDLAADLEDGGEIVDVFLRVLP